MQVTIPNDDTTYWCAALELPQEVQQQRQYIVKVAILIESKREYQMSY